jgi:hypothetical protein
MSDWQTDLPAEIKNLLRCPFCGGLATIATEGHPASAARCVCVDCGAYGPSAALGLTGSGVVCDMAAFLGGAVDAWNTRAKEGNQ